MDNSSLLGDIGVQITCIQHALSLSCGKYRLSILVIALGSVQVERIEANLLLSLGATYRKVGELLDDPLLKLFFKLGFSFLFICLRWKLGVKRIKPLRLTCINE